MRIVVVLLVLWPNIAMIAQRCDTSLLFKKGAEFEYRSYLPKTKLLSKKSDHFEITRITYFIDDVKDSNSTVYSYVTKKGVAANNENNYYEKKYVISCKDGRVAVPADFYSIDTIYLIDIYPKLDRDRSIRKNKFYMGTTNKEQVTYFFPLSANKNKFEASSGKLNTDVIKRDFGWERRDNQGRLVFPGQPGGHYQLSNSIDETKYSLSAELADLRIEGNETIKVSAGSFNSGKIFLKMKIKLSYPKNFRHNSPEPNLDGKTVETIQIFYFDPQVGLVKAESPQGGYTELVRTKK